MKFSIVNCIVSIVFFCLVLGVDSLMFREGSFIRAVFETEHGYAMGIVLVGIFIGAMFKFDDE